MCSTLHKFALILAAYLTIIYTKSAIIDVWHGSINSLNFCLTHFMPRISFDTPWKKVFWCFHGLIGLKLEEHCAGWKYYFVFNQFLANVLILYLLTIPENLQISGLFRGCRMGTLTINRLIKSFWYRFFFKLARF